MSAEQKGRSEPRKRKWHFRDSEDLEWFTAKGYDLVQQSPLGGQLERLRDHVGLVFGVVETTPPWLTGFHSQTDSANARRIALRLIRVGELCPEAPSVLWAYHHPVAVALDGVTFREKDTDNQTSHGKLDVGRLLALYPGTATGAEARRWFGCYADRKAVGGLERGMRRISVERMRPGPAEEIPYERIGQVMARNGRSAEDACRLMAKVKLSAKGEERREWARIDREARVLLEASQAAWLSTYPPAKGGKRQEYEAEFRDLEVKTRIGLDGES